MYEVREKDGHAVIVDADGKSIVDIVEQFDDGMGCKVLTPVFTPDMAFNVVRALNGFEVKLRLTVDASGAIHALTDPEARRAQVTPHILVKRRKASGRK